MSLGTVPEDTPETSIAFAKQSFRHPLVDEFLKDSAFAKEYADVLEGIIRNVKTQPGGFKATSGVILPYYLNLTTNFMDFTVAPKIVHTMAYVLIKMHAELGLGPNERACIAGMEVAGGMLAAQLAAANIPELNKLYDFVYVRKNKKATGTAQQLEGPLEYTSRTPQSALVKTVWVDDVNSTGSSLCDGIKVLKEDYNMEVLQALYYVDRSVDRANLELSRQKLAHPHFVSGKTIIRAVMDLKEIDPQVKAKHNL